MEKYKKTIILENEKVRIKILKIKNEKMRVQEDKKIRQLENENKMWSLYMKERDYLYTTPPRDTRRISPVTHFQQ